MGEGKGENEKKETMEGKGNSEEIKKEGKKRKEKKGEKVEAKKNGNADGRTEEWKDGQNERTDRRTEIRKDGKTEIRTKPVVLTLPVAIPSSCSSGLRGGRRKEVKEEK